MPAPKVNFNSANLTQTVPSQVTGINFVLGRSIRGPFNDPSVVINSWTSFVNIFGGLSSMSAAPRLVKRLLEQGGSVRFCRVEGYDRTVPENPVGSATKADAIIFEDGFLDPLFSLQPKHAGEDYNNLKVTITNGANGQPGYFNLRIQHDTDKTLNEEYTNLIIEGKPTLEEANFLRRVSESSQLVDVEYRDLSYMADDQIMPEATEVNFTGGSDGTAPIVDDYIGDEVLRNGFYAFDPYDDSMQIGVFDMDDDSLHVAGANYARNRGDLQYFLHLSNNLTTPAALIAKRQSLNIDNKYVCFGAGGILLRDPLTSQVLATSGIADMMILANKTDQDYGTHYSFAGNTRGIVGGALGVVNNFGAPASHKDLDNLIDAGINLFINRDGAIKLWGNRSGQYKNDQERFNSIVRLVITLKKELRPALEDFIEEPNDIAMWRRMYFTVKPYLDNKVDSRALYSYRWLGDQFARSMDELAINDANDVSQGKYKVLLPIKAIPSLQEINVTMILTPAGVDFEIVSELI